MVCYRATKTTMGTYPAPQLRSFATSSTSAATTCQCQPIDASASDVSSTTAGSQSVIPSVDPSSSKPKAATVTVCDKPNQPSDVSLYPVQNTGSLCKNGRPKLRFMNIDWYSKYSWLHWDVWSQKLFGFICLNVKKTKRICSISYGV